ncbi:hypothetical protein Goklo_017076, partial [Gossypium klotzschianum]|nr:hypothetical protein [Gossypium klotzschianum]
QFDVLRFRSICRSWRSSFPPKLYPLPKRLHSSKKTKAGCRFSLNQITIATLFLVRLPPATENRSNQTDPSCWLIKISDGKPLNPLTDSGLNANLPKVLDLINCQVIELGHGYVGRYSVDINYRFRGLYRNYIEKVEILRLSPDGDDFMVVGLFSHGVEYLALLKSGENEWTVLENMHGIQDIITSNNKFYAIEQSGGTIIVDQFFSVGFIQHAVGSPTDRKFLVESSGNLLIVEMIFLENSESNAGFRIFKLDEENQKWDEIKSLGDQILILGLHQVVSASAYEFHWGDQGNLIFYSIDGNVEDRVMYVFDLEKGISIPLENCPVYCNLFWPLPVWLNSSKSVVSSSMEATPGTEFANLGICEDVGSSFSSS